MIYSMTGYAAASREFSYGVLNLELRSVNHRYLDIQFRLPDELRSVESQLRELLAARFGAGQGRLPRRPSRAEPARARRCISTRICCASWRRSRPRCAACCPTRAACAPRTFCAGPACSAPTPFPLEELQQACRELLATAIDELAATRRREGERLKALLLERIAAMETHIAGVAPRIPQVVAAFQEKLAARLKEALAGADDERIRQEVALFADQDRRGRGAVAALDPRRRS